jgi:hypothetical protein
MMIVRISQIPGAHLGADRNTHQAEPSSGFGYRF